MRFLLFALSTASAPSTKTMKKSSGREFKLVPYGKSFESPDGRPTISCDGRIPGVDLEITHWNGNETPDRLYADTSTEMALKFAKLDDEFKNAWILNNHYDTDGVLSSWACLKPEMVLPFAELMRQGAEAGDFGEWSSDNGVKLDCAIEAILSKQGDEESAYQEAFSELPSLLEDLQHKDGENYRHLWEDGFEEAQEGWKELESGRATLKRGPGRMVILHEPAGGRLPPYCLDRGLKSGDLWKDTTRVLRVMESADSYEFHYEKVGHGWVQKVVDRHIVPPMDGSKLASELNELNTNGSEWKAGGPGSLVAICQGSVPKGDNVDADDVAKMLYKLDSGCQ